MGVPVLGMEVVNGITIGLLAAGLFAVWVSAGGGVRLDDECRADWRRLTRATGVLLLASGFLCAVDSLANIDVEEIDEPVIIESQRIIEGRLSSDYVIHVPEGTLAEANGE